MIDQRFAPYAATLLRISLGTMWIAHALLKFFVFSIPGFAAFLSSQGMPSVLAWPVFLMELGGGILMVLGAHGRIASLLLLPIMAGAASVHFGNGWIFTSSNGGWEYPAFLFAASVVHGLLGDGAYALTSKHADISTRLKTV